MTRCHSHCSGSENRPTYNQQLDAEQIQSLIDQRIKEHLGGAGSQRVGAAFNHPLDSYPQRPHLPVMLPTGMPTYGSEMPEAEQTQSLITLIDQRIKDHLGAAGFQQAVIPGYGGQPLSPPPTVPGGTTHTSNAPPNPGAMCQGNPITPVSGAVDGYNSNEDASVLQSPTQGSAFATSCLLTKERRSQYVPPHKREAKKLADRRTVLLSEIVDTAANGSTVRFGSWNVGSLTGNLSEIVDIAARNHVNILCVQEIKWSGRDEEEVEDTGFELWYKGSGVGILIDKSLKNRVIGVTRKCRSILVKLIVDNMVLNVISASAPQVGASENAKWFWKALNGLVRSVPRIEKLFIGGDFHGQVGTSGQNFERVHGGFGYGDINQEGEEILNFATANDLIVANTFFRKEKSRIVTFIDGQNSSQINFFLARRRDRLECKDCEVIPEECVGSQHQLLISDFVFGPKFMAGGVTKKRKKTNGRSKEDRRVKQPTRADGEWHLG